MLNLIVLIQLSDVDLGSFKIHCAVKSGPTDPDDPFFETTGDPLDYFIDGQFEDWQTYQRNENFRCDSIVSLIQMRTPDEWLFGDAYRVDGVTAGRGWTD